MYGPVLEVINSLVAAFIFTEIFRHCNYLSLTSLALQYIFPWIFLNILIRHVSFVNQVVSRWAELGYILLRPFTAIGEMLGSSVIIYILVTSLFLTWKYIVFSNSKDSNSKWMNPYDVYYIILGFTLCAIFRLLGFDGVVSHTESMKVPILTAFFIVLLYFDVRRIRLTMPLHVFGRALVDAITFSVVAIPFAAILISCMFLLIVSFLEKIGANPEHSELMNRLVFYGTLYGPFYLIYWNAKKRLLALPQLPTCRC